MDDAQVAGGCVARVPLPLPAPEDDAVDPGAITQRLPARPRPAVPIVNAAALPALAPPTDRVPRWVVVALVVLSGIAAVLGVALAMR